jgi:hypothetical protein
MHQVARYSGSDERSILLHFNFKPLDCSFLLSHLLSDGTLTLDTFTALVLNDEETRSTLAQPVVSINRSNTGVMGPNNIF